MLNIGPQELLLILVLALLVVGPKRLPELGRSLGKGLRELRKAQDEVRKTIQVNLDEPKAQPAHRPGRRLPAEPAADGPGADGVAEGAADEAKGAEAGDPVTGAVAAPAPVVAASSTGVGEVSRTLGRSLAELRRAREEIQRSFRVDLDAPAPSRPAPGRSRPEPPGTAPEVPAAPSDPSEAAPERDAPGDDAVDRPG